MGPAFSARRPPISSKRRPVLIDFIVASRQMYRWFRYSYYPRQYAPLTVASYIFFCFGVLKTNLRDFSEIFYCRWILQSIQKYHFFKSITQNLSNSVITITTIMKCKEHPFALSAYDSSLIDTTKNCDESAYSNPLISTISNCDGSEFIRVGLDWSIESYDRCNDRCTQEPSFLLSNQCIRKYSPSFFFILVGKLSARNNYIFLYTKPLLPVINDDRRFHPTPLFSIVYGFFQFMNDTSPKTTARSLAHIASTKTAYKDKVRDAFLA